MDNTRIRVGAEHFSVGDEYRWLAACDDDGAVVTFTGKVRNHNLGSDVSTLTLLFNSVHIDAQDPGGLTEAQWRDNPRQVVSNVPLYNTRKTVDQTQGGLRYQRQMSENDDLSVMLYAGMRETTQFQSIPAAVQRNPSHPGDRKSVV